MPNLKIPVSGMTAAVKRTEAAASNIVNAGSNAPLEAVEPVGAPHPARPDRQGVGTGYRPVRVEQVSRAAGGTEAVARPLDPAVVRAYEPSDPDADEEGFVGRPNVSPEDELVELSRARHAYEANLKVIKALDEALGTLIDSEV